MRVFILIFTALVAACRLAHAAETLSGPYPAQILRVINGDTVEARVHVWLGLDVTTRVHLRNMDSPELHGPCPDAGQAARDALIGLLGDNPVILSRIANDKYGGRVDAVMTLPTGVDVSTAMLAAGHARKIKGDFNCPSTAPRAKGRTRATPIWAPE
ncbi:MAG: nuclease [Rhodospirillaceae bacterium]|nr:nuclease [Rhodospirillales bacterium]